MRTQTPTIHRLFELIRARGALMIPALGKVKLKLCTLADQEHEDSERQFMHYNHIRRTVCYARAAEDLALKWKIGLVGHELGHAAADLLGSMESHSEEDANRLGSAILGSRIIYAGRLRLEQAKTPIWLTKEISSWEDAGHLESRS